MIAKAGPPPRVAAAELPPAFRIALDPSVRVFEEGRLVLGGQPPRLLRLAPAAWRVIEALQDCGGRTPAVRRLGRRLVDGGLAHPRPPTPTALPEVTVVVPVRDRAEALGRCLSALRGDGEALVLVVDDGSIDPQAVATCCERFGARLVRLESSRGPAGARNAGLAEVDTELVAFIDSDCIVPLGWLRALAGHLQDDSVAAVAPRVRPAPGQRGGSSALSRYLAARSPLDLGSQESAVGPGGAVPYVPTAALLVRHSALGAGFDEGLRYGEDVDLIWRTLAEGWQVRYDPSVVVGHEEPTTWRRCLERRFHYGSSAAPLAKRHDGELAPLRWRPLPLAVASAVVFGRWRLATLGLVVLTARLNTVLRRGGATESVALAVALERSLRSVLDTVLGIGRTAAGVGAPPLLLYGFGSLVLGASRPHRQAIASRRRSRGEPGVVAKWALVLLAPPLVLWARRRPNLDPARFALASVLDDAAYGAGVWWSSLCEHTVAPLLPRRQRVKGR